MAAGHPLLGVRRRDGRRRDDRLRRVAERREIPRSKIAQVSAKRRPEQALQPLRGQREESFPLAGRKGLHHSAELPVGCRPGQLLRRLWPRLGLPRQRHAAEGGQREFHGRQEPFVREVPGASG